MLEVSVQVLIKNWILSMHNILCVHCMLSGYNPGCMYGPVHNMCYI